jgi:hypothetical protein
MLEDALPRWPFIRQILSGGDGAGVEAMSARETHVKYRAYSTKWEELDLEPRWTGRRPRSGGGTHDSAQHSDLT